MNSNDAYDVIQAIAQILEMTGQAPKARMRHGPNGIRTVRFEPVGAVRGRDVDVFFNPDAELFHVVYNERFEAGEVTDIPKMLSRAFVWARGR